MPRPGSWFRKLVGDAEKLKQQLQAENQAHIEKARKEATDRIAHEAELARAELQKFAGGPGHRSRRKVFSRKDYPNSRKRQLTDRTLPEIESAISKN